MLALYILCDSPVFVRPSELVGRGLVAPAQEPYCALAVIPSGLRLQLFVRRFTELPPG